MIIWAALDPTNMMVPPAMGPLFISLAYAAVIWGFATPAVALNTARDLGARLFAMSIWGTKAAGSGYSAIACLINIPATLLGVFLYEVFFTDSDRVVSPAALTIMNAHANHRRLHHGHGEADKRDSTEKPTITTYEHAGGNGVEVSHV